MPTKNKRDLLVRKVLKHSFPNCGRLSNELVARKLGSKIVYEMVFAEVRTYLNCHVSTKLVIIYIKISLFWINTINCVDVCLKTKTELQ